MASSQSDSVDNSNMDDAIYLTQYFIIYIPKTSHLNHHKTAIEKL